MKNAIKTAIAVTLVLAVFGCSKPSDTDTTASATPAAQPATATPSADKVAVAAEGSKFDPAVPVAQMPDGAWACVMGGTVHYAAMDKGEGKCKICKMKLVQPAGDQ